MVGRTLITISIIANVAIDSIDYRFAAHLELHERNVCDQHGKEKLAKSFLLVHFLASIVVVFLLRRRIRRLVPAAT